MLDKLPLGGIQGTFLLKSETPDLLAFQYTAPITMMIHLCDREPDRKPVIMNKIKAHIRQFADEHKITERISE